MKPYSPSFLAIILFISLLTIQQILAETFDQSYQTYAAVLDAYVKDGLVNYSGLKSNPNDLDQYLKQTSLLSRKEFDSWTENEQLAFLINLYNAQTLDLIVDNYPVKSIKDIAADSGGPWEQPVVALFGGNMTLNALEHEVIRKNHPEARVHFALVCAALGCPVLINKPYLADTLDNQLNAQTKVFLLDPEKNSIDTNAKILRLSPIFDWFKQDFIKQSGSVTAFVNPYYGNRANDKFKIEYTDYDWSLNDKATKKY